jgi:putative flippase GtrA
VSSESLLGRLRREYGAKAVKYASVSVINVLVGQGLLFFFSKIVELTFVEANIAAVCLSAIPAFILSRRWIWQLKTRSHFMREVVPFWSIALLGLLLSTVMVAIAQQFSEATWVLMFTNLSAFGLLWVGKFFFLDKVLFGPHHHEFDENLEEEVAELEAKQAAEHEGHRPDPDSRENVGEATA